ncbi:MAG: ornithine carbamoyltransferase [Desulfovibrionaceae bacterium]|nr:ornithine carbamoyltransferase [Desulfovibrionaceae bacterium]
MGKSVLTIRELGEKTCWLLVQQAIGIPDAKMRTDFLSEKVAVLFFAAPSLPERLCVSAAFRQMGGAVVYEVDSSGDAWRDELHQHQAHLLPIFDFYLDCIYIYGIPVNTYLHKELKVDFPTINAGSPDAHPSHALADIAYMLKTSRYLNSVPATWLGTPNGTLYSLVAASEWFPFSLKIFTPPNSDLAHLKTLIGDSKKIEIVDNMKDAVKDAKYIFAGSRRDIDFPSIKNWELNRSVLSPADKNFRIFLGARPINCLPIDQELMESSASLLLQQSEYRLRIHKRILHWVFSL